MLEGDRDACQGALTLLFCLLPAPSCSLGYRRRQDACETSTNSFPASQYCEKFNISLSELQNTPESVTNVAYTRFVLDTTMRGDLLDALVVKHACLKGYGEAARRIVERDEAGEGNVVKEGNVYWDWIKEYAGEWYQGAVGKGTGALCFSS